MNQRCTVLLAAFFLVFSAAPTWLISDEMPSDSYVTFEEAKREAEKFVDILDKYRIGYKGIWLIGFWLDDYEHLLDVNLLRREIDAMVLGSDMKIMFNYNRLLQTSMGYKWDLEHAIGNSNRTESEKEFLFCLLNYTYMNEPFRQSFYLYETNRLSRSFIAEHGEDNEYSVFLAERIITKAPELPWSGGAGYSIGLGLFEGSLPNSMNIGGSLLVSFRRLTFAPVFEASLFLGDEETPATGHFDLPVGYRIPLGDYAGFLVCAGPNIQFTPEYESGPFITSIAYMVTGQVEVFSPYAPGVGLELISRSSLGVTVRFDVRDNVQFARNISFCFGSMPMGSGPNPQYSSQRVY